MINTVDKGLSKNKVMDIEYLNLCDFDYDIYREHEDLKEMTNDELTGHFFTYGIAEGRIYCHVKGRKDFTDLLSSSGKILEIGPLDRPQFDHHSPDYYSVDVFTRKQLINNYVNDPTVNKENIIKPTYVIADNDYSAIKEKFNCIFSSHNIEHMPCLMTFLNNLSGVLSDDGHIYLAIPDKRYCFDHFKKETDIYDILQLHFEKNYRPRFSDILRMGTQITHNNPIDHWNNIHGEINPEIALTQIYQGILNQYNTGIYTDAHVNQFTPENFVKIITTLNKLKLINLKVDRIYHTLYGSLEFYAILKKSG